MAKNFLKIGSSPVQTHTIRDVTSSSPGKIHKITKDSTYKIYPTSAGTANVYISNTPQVISNLDTSNADIIASTNARWTEWDDGGVTVETTAVSNGPMETAALVVTSGTWNIEITS